MDVRLARIDDRLIHGQVASVWPKLLSVNRILVVNDEAAQGTLTKTLLKQAAPPGVKVNVITVDKMIQIFPDEKYADFKAMLLFKNPQDVAYIVKGGVGLTSVNIGRMSFSDGKKMITTAVAVDQQDVAAFQYLTAQGIELEVRKLASDTKEDLMYLLKKEQLI